MNTLVSHQDLDFGMSELSVHDHPCSIYENTDELKRQFVPYLQVGLLSGERCVYFVDENPPSFVIEAMQENGFDLAPYIENGAFCVISTRDAHLSRGHFSEEKMMSYWLESMSNASRSGFSAMRVAVEMTWALSDAPGCELLAPYEARLNDFVKKHDVSIICQYSRKKFSAEKLKAVIHAHPTLVANDQVLSNHAMVHHERFVENSAELDLQALMDNMLLVKKLQTANDTLQQAFEDLHEVCYVISHELQEPLTTIRSYQKLLSVRYTGRLGADADDFIQRCSSASAIVERMIDDLWTYARVTKPGQTFARVDTRRALGTALKKLEGLIGSSKAEVSHGPLPMVIGVEEQISDLFRRLIENAIKHAGASNPSIVIFATMQDDGYWQFSVCDSGVGIDTGRIPEAFKIFSRLDKRPGLDGTGMGLPICRKIAEHHNGSLRIDSRKGNGVTALFSLPPSKIKSEPTNIEEFANKHPRPKVV